mmetsp:Transcript_7717/g.16958  ORF Transcript_7717/g.16958 Transcript_7717/m.16958 type:complete len:245 (-) Transcript_7717:88-822(-)
MTMSALAKVGVQVTLAEVLVKFSELCNRAEGRDKVTRFLQYLARTVFGFTNLAYDRYGLKFTRSNKVALNVMEKLSGARRTHRWFKEIPIIVAAVEGAHRRPLHVKDAFDQCLEMSQKATMAAFLVVDHAAWLKQAKLLRGGKRAGVGTVQLGLKFCFASSCIALFRHLKQLCETRQSEGWHCAGWRWCLALAVKHFFLAVQAAHLSRLYTSHDMLVGILGMVTSAMDVIAQWPRNEPKAVLPR